MLENTKEIVFYDPIVESGHKEFNKLFIQKYGLAKVFSLRINVNFYLSYHFKSFINHFKFLKKSKEEDVFLVFNNFSLFLNSFLIRNINCHFIVHNNLDFGTKNFLQSIFYKRICKKFKLIYLEDRLKFEANRFFFHKNAITIYHPIINIRDENSIKKSKVFVSGRNLNEEQLINICNLEKEKEVFCNDDNFNCFRKNLFLGYIDNFDKLLNECQKIYIIGDYSKRPSGILYRALSIRGAKIIFSNKEYFDEISILVIKLKLNCKLVLLNEI